MVLIPEHSKIVYLNHTDALNNLLALPNKCSVTTTP